MQKNTVSIIMFIKEWEKMKKQQIMNLLLIVVILFMTMSCNSGTKPRKGNLELEIQLEGQEDNSGVTILLYPNHTDLFKDSKLESHPKLSIIDSKALFDHRMFTPIEQSITGSDGKGRIDNIERGYYTICIYKEGWGYRYLFDVLVEGNNKLLDKLILYQEQKLEQTIINDFVFETDRTYRIDSTLLATQNSQLTFQTGANLIFGADGSLNIMGGINCPNNSSGFGRFTSADKIYQFATNFIRQGSVKVSSNPEVTIIQNQVFSYLYDGLMVYRNDSKINNNYFYGSLWGLQILNTSQITIDNNIFYNNYDNQGAAVYSYRVNHLGIERNYFIKNWFSALLEFTSASIVADNYFDSGKYEVYTNWETIVDVKYNLIQGSGTGIVNAGRCDVNITFNDINKDICIATFMNQSQLGTSTFGFTTANNNNLTYKTRSVDSRAMYDNGGEPLTMDFKNNYWNTINQNEIQDSIYDFYTSPPSPYPHLNWAIIDFVPFKSAKILNAGIR